MPPSVRAFPALPGSGARCISCGISWLTYRRRRRNPSQLNLKRIWPAPSAELARQRAEQLAEQYRKRFPKAIELLEDGLEDSPAFYAFADLDTRKTSSTNMLERLNKEIRRRTNVVGIFPDPDSYLRLVTTYLMEYAEDWSVSRAYLNSISVHALLQNAA